MKTGTLPLALLVLALCTAAAARDAGQPVTIDPASKGRVFEGLGALSAGASSRLLADYPQPQRGQVLDFLFKPHYGAALQHLKVEVGGDVNSTDGTEPSHARTREEFDHPRPEYYQRGYEWWLMREAKKRNPAISLDVLQWGAPAWIGGHKFYSQDNADFIAAFMHGAQEHHGLDINSCGIWNEKPYDVQWIKLLRKTLDRRGLEGVEIVAADEINQWTIADRIRADPELAAAVAVVGSHYPQSKSTPVAIAGGKRLWASEDGPWRGDWSAACILAKAFNRNYIQGRMTKTVIWSLVSSYYDVLPLPNSGPMKALQPWSGHYEVQPAIWAIAHTTQFAQPGWRYLDDACGLLAGQGSFVTLRGPGASEDYSIVIETVDAKAPQTMLFRVADGLSTRPLAVWRSSQRSQFERLADIPVTAGQFSVTLEPGAIYSLTTTAGQRKGAAQPPPPAEFPCPYADDFESYAADQQARYFSDQSGVFAVVKRPDGRGKCLRQVVPEKGIEWQPMFEPYTILGSAKWQDYEVAAEAYIESAGSVSLYGRIAAIAQNADPPQGYIFSVRSDGRWTLRARRATLAEGRAAFAAGQWHRLRLTMAGPRITAAIDGKEAGAAVDMTCRRGLAGLGSGWNSAMFDDFSVRPVAPGPALANLAAGKPAAASSQWSDAYAARCAVDGNDETRWNSAPGKLAGEWLQLDFGRKTRFDCVAVRQFQNRITKYKIQYLDGDRWVDAVSGDTQGQASWVARFAPVAAEKLRLLVVAVRGSNAESDTPSIFELEVYHTAAAQPDSAHGPSSTTR
jgi:galactosylceramidase